MTELPGPDPAKPVASSSTKFGQPIVATTAVSLVDLAKSPASFKGKAVTTTGKVTKVCQEAGCWMAIKDSASPEAMVRMHGHSFFVPPTAAGRQAKVQGTIQLVKDGKECDDITAVGAAIELDATGVELDPS